MEPAGVRVADGDVATAPGGIPRGHVHEPELAGEFDSEPGERPTLRGDCIDPCVDRQSDALAGCGESEHRWRAVEHPTDAAPRVERALHRKLVVLGEPPPDRLGHPVVDSFRHVDERGSSRTAVEELVGTADREVDAGTMQVQYENAGGM